MEAQVGKVGDFENGQDTSLAVRETEKRIIMLFNHIFNFKKPATEINQVSNFCHQMLENIYNYVHIKTNVNDFENIIPGIEKNMSDSKNTELMMNQLDTMLRNLNANAVDDDKITVKDHGRLFLQLEPDNWFQRLLYKISDYIKYVFYQKKGNLLSTTHWQTEKYLIEKRFPKVDQSLVLKEENKITDDEVKEDNYIDSSTKTDAELHEEAKGSEEYLIAK